MKALANRLTKNHKKLKKWLKTYEVEAYRIYDKDIPEYPYIIDIYNKYAVIFEKGKRLGDDEQELRENHQKDVQQAISETLGIQAHKCIFKIRKKNKGITQYEKLSTEDNTTVITENNAKFIINLTDYLDTGLFLDHRALRSIIAAQSQNKTLLNLFSYTSSFSVHAALAGATTTSVDMSKTYIEWSKNNFQLNEIDLDNHKFYAQNTFEFLKENERDQFYDIIVCDPPSFSNSKKMTSEFDVQRDHIGLINLCMNWLDRAGVLYFSCNLRSFKLDDSLKDKFDIKDISLKTIDPDFRDLKIHYCFKICFKS